MKLVFDFDPSKCTACGACAIACMDQNDIDMDAGQRPYRRIAQVESETELVYLSAACLHCPDAPCIPACPKACLYHDDYTGLVEYDNTGCVGCHACQRACPYNRGVPLTPLPEFREGLQFSGQISRILDHISEKTGKRINGSIITPHNR